MKEREIEICETVIAMLFKKESEEKITMSNVANRIGLAKSSLYEYYKNKDEMIFQALVYMFEKNQKGIHEGIVSGFEETFKKRLGQVMDSIVSFPSYEELPLMMLNHVVSDEARKKIKSFMLDQQDRQIRLFKELCQVGQTEGILKDNLSEFELEATMVMINGLIIKRIHSKKNEPLKQFIDQTYQLTLKMLGE